MTWTKTKTVVVASMILALVAMAVVKLVLFPSVSDACFQFNAEKLRQAPANVVLLRSTHFSKSTRSGVMNIPSTRKGNSVQWMMGRNVSLLQVIATAYSYNPGRVALPFNPPKGNYDFLVTVAADPEKHLQSAIRRKLGYTAQVETRDTPVLALTVENPNSTGLKVSTAARDDVSPRNGRLYFTHMKLSVVTDGLEGMLKMPVVDKTGLTNFYDFSLVWDAQTQRQIQSGTLDNETGKKILAEWGLGLEPDTESLEMLVVKK